MWKLGHLARVDAGNAFLSAEENGMQDGGLTTGLNASLGIALGILPDTTVLLLDNTKSGAPKHCDATHFVTIFRAK